MIDLAKERKAFIEFKKEEPQNTDGYDAFLAWIYRATQAETEITELKQKIKGLKDLNIDLQYSRQRVRVELSDLDGVFTELKQKLARYENPDYVLVPRSPTREMCILGSKEHAGYDEVDTKSIYKAMIEVMETKNA